MYIIVSLLLMASVIMAKNFQFIDKRISLNLIIPHIVNIFISGPDTTESTYDDRTLVNKNLVFNASVMAALNNGGVLVQNYTNGKSFYTN